MKKILISVFLAVAVLGFCSGDAISKKTEKSYDSLYSAVKSAIKNLPKERRKTVLDSLNAIDKNVQDKKDMALLEVYSDGVNELNNLLQIISTQSSAQ